MCKKIITHPDAFCITHIGSPTVFLKGIIIFQGVLTKLNFQSNFHIYLNLSILMKNLKFEHQSILPLLERIKLTFRDKYGKPNIFSENSSCCQVFPPNCQKITLWHNKENHYPPRWICIIHIWSPHTIP